MAKKTSCCASASAVKAKSGSKAVAAAKCEIDNLGKLRKSNILMNFVKKNNGCWDHQGWVGLCDYLKEKGYTPIDFDQVGLILEEKKVAFLSGKEC